MERFLNENEVLVGRLKGTHVLSAEDAINFSVTGPVLRASGVPYDLRRADPYSIYDRFDFDVAVRHNGDMMDNYLIRFDEIRQSLRILEQALKQIPQGPINSQKPNYQIKVPAGEAYGRIEVAQRRTGFLYRLERQSEIPIAIMSARLPLSTSPPLKRCASAQRFRTSSRLLAMLDIVMGEVDR